MQDGTGISSRSAAAAAAAAAAIARSGEVVKQRELEEGEECPICYQEMKGGSDDHVYCRRAKRDRAGHVLCVRSDSHLMKFLIRSHAISHADRPSD